LARRCQPFAPVATWVTCLCPHCELPLLLGRRLTAGGSLTASGTCPAAGTRKPNVGGQESGALARGTSSLSSTARPPTVHPQTTATESPTLLQAEGCANTEYYLLRVWSLSQEPRSRLLPRPLRVHSIHFSASGPACLPRGHDLTQHGVRRKPPSSMKRVLPQPPAQAFHLLRWHMRVREASPGSQPAPEHPDKLSACSE
jgi:hypothetical protein